MSRLATIALLIGLMATGIVFAQESVSGPPENPDAAGMGSGAPPPPPPGFGGPGGPGGGPGGPKMTAEEREKVKAMTPEQRKAYFEQKRQEWLASLSTEERAKIEARMKEEEAERAKVKTMSETERKAYFEQKRQAWLASLSTEERAKVEARMQSRQQQFQSAGPAQADGTRVRPQGRRGNRRGNGASTGR